MGQDKLTYRDKYKSRYETSVIAEILFNNRRFLCKSKSRMIEIDAKADFATKRLDYLYGAMREQKWIDVNFIVRNRSFSAHMVVLVACSEFFANNKDNLGAIFSDFEYPVIDAILKYCYTGKINIDDKYYEKFMELTAKLQIKSIVPRYKTIDETNCLEALHLSDDPPTREKAMDLTLENFRTLQKMPSFLGLPAASLAEILKSDNLNVDSEEQVFESVKLWLISDEENRRSELAELLRHLKLPLLSIETANCIDIYDGMNKSWTLTKNFSFNRRCFASALVNYWIMIIGGYNSLYDAITSVEYVDLKDGQKHSLKPLNQGRKYFPAVTIRRDSSTDVYVIGGYDDKANILSSVERWNSTTMIWETSIAPLLQAVYWHNASVIGDRIYVTGGHILKDGKNKSTDEVQVYEMQSNSWSYCAPMIQRREEHSSIAIKGKLFVAGGYCYDGSRLDGVESYDPDTDLWQVFCTLPNPTHGITLCFFRQKLLCMGGDDGKRLRNVLEYDDMRKTWKSLESLNKSRWYSFAHVIPYHSAI
ncbi:kelch-like protein 25 [Arctopsyche grandis]|uniref:kelch-like protein 25 n=1 Tax=Arctopsyche grandis TaxID=121162 RepID=UPI00406DA1DC